MLAIHTKYIGATDTRGARIKAFTWGYGYNRGVTASVPIDHSLNDVEMHFEAVKALVEKYKLGWNLEGMRYGDSADGKGYVFCFDASRVHEQPVTLTYKRALELALALLKDPEADEFEANSVTALLEQTLKGAQS